MWSLQNLSNIIPTELDPGGRMNESGAKSDKKGEPPLHLFHSLIEVVDVFIQHLPELLEEVYRLFPPIPCSRKPEVGPLLLICCYVSILLLIICTIIIGVMILGLFFSGQLPLHQLLRPEDGQQYLLSRRLMLLHMIVLNCGFK